MHHAKIALIRPPMEDRLQLGEMTLRSFAILANEKRQPEDRIITSIILVEDVSELRDVGVRHLTAIVACGIHNVTEEVGGVHYFDSLAAMQAGIATLLSTRFPVDDPLKESTEYRPPCPICGHISVRNGACYKCLNCGESIGCS